MFRVLICPSSWVCDYVIELPHWPFRSWFAVCWSLNAVRLGWYQVCRLKNNSACASAGNPDTTPAELQPNSNTQQTKKETANVVVQQHSRIFMKMGILMPKTCWISKKWNQDKKWHLVGFLFFKYHNDARSNKHLPCWMFLSVQFMLSYGIA